MMTAQEAFAVAARHLPPALAFAGKLTGRGAVEAQADGARITLSDGRSVLDFGSYAVTLLGHRHPAVLDAVRAQLEIMPVSSRTLVNPTTARAAERLVAYLGGTLPRVYFGLNGSDAVEAAIKLARLATGRPRVLAVDGAYHGKSMGSLAVTHHPRFRAGLTDLLPGATHIRPEDFEGVARETAAGDVAALILEPIQGENGVRVLDPDVLRRWAADAHSAGAFVVADEIQCGLRRCGPRSPALEADLPIDGLLLGKPLGGGVVPVSALVCTEDLYRPLKDDPSRHTLTFGGQPLGAAAIPATLDAIEELAAHAAGTSHHFAASLHELRRGWLEAIVGVRGRGLLWGIDFADDALAGEVFLGLGERGLIVSPCLGRPATIRLLPPMVADERDMDTALSIVDDSVAAAVRVRRSPDESGISTARAAR